MKRIPFVTLAVLTCSGLMLAQDAPSGWRRMSDPAPAPAAGQQDNSQSPAAPQGSVSQADRTGSDAYGQPATTQPQTTDPQTTQPQTTTPAQRPSYGLPPQLTIKPGTFVTVRVNQPLSTDHNHVGDTFTVSLMSPIIVDGVIVANRGQLGYGRVAELEKQHSDKPSRLGLELTSVTLADGTQAPVTSQLVAQQGGRTPGAVQGGTVVGTTAVGAAVGGIAAGGGGAAAGAGIGAAAGIVGVLLTRNHPTVIYPETALTFQITSPVTVVTSNSPQAFRFVGANDRPMYSYSERPGPQPQMAPAPAPAPPPAYYYGYPYYYGAYGYPYYPYYYGPSVFIGGGWGWGGGWGRGWGRGFGGGFGFRGGRR